MTRRRWFPPSAYCPIAFPAMSMQRRIARGNTFSTRLGRLFLISPEFWANYPFIPGKGFSGMAEIFVAELPLFLGFHSQENAKHLDF